MIRTDVFYFETIETMPIPAEYVDFGLEGITESVYLRRDADEQPYAARGKVIEQGYITIRKAWFTTIAGRIIDLVRYGAGDSLAERTLSHSFGLSKEEVTTWAAAGLSDDQMSRKIVAVLTDSFVETIPSDLVDVMLVTLREPGRVLTLPWPDPVDGDTGEFNPCAVNLETADKFITLIDAHDRHMQENGREKARKLGFVVN